MGALVISFQASLEGTIASFGPVITVLLNNFFGYDPACNNECPLTRPPECNADQNAEALEAGSCRSEHRADECVSSFCSDTPLGSRPGEYLFLKTELCFFALLLLYSDTPMGRRLGNFGATFRVDRS